MKAHLHKRRQVGEREEVDIKLLNNDGSPFAVEVPGNGDWVTVPNGSMQNTWAPLAGGTEMQYRKESDDSTIRIRGMIAPGIDGLIFTFPAAFRPAKDSHFVCAANNGAFVIRIEPNGQMTPVTSVSGVNWVSLAGVTFSSD